MSESIPDEYIDDPLEGTIDRFLATSILRFDDWFEKEDGEDVVFASYRHKIVLVKYILGALLIAGLGALLGYAIGSWELFAFSLAPAALILFVGAWRYWQIYYIVTTHRVVVKTSVLTGNIDEKRRGKIQTAKRNQSLLSRFSQLLWTEYGDIKISTAGEGDGGDFVMKTVPRSLEVKDMIRDLAKDDDAL